MRARSIITFLLIMVLAIAATGRAALVQDEDTQITPDEEWEARQIANEFTRRFDETHDLASIMDDLYVKDFKERLRHNPQGYFFISLRPEVALQATDEDLRRYYTTSLNFIYTGAFIGAAIKTIQKESNDEESEDKESELVREIIFSPQVTALLKSDPLLARALAEEEEGKEGSPAEPEKKADPKSETEGGKSSGKVEDDEMSIKTVEHLRSYLSTIEQVIALIREHLKSLPVPQTWQGLLDAARNSGQEADDAMGPRAYTTSNDYFGCPAGTRLICLDAMMFHMDLIRVDGQLKILNLYFVFD
jgi:hypothetical protein